MNRSHALLAALVAAAALWAYFVVHPLSGGATSAQVSARVWDVPLRTVERFTFHDGDTHTTLEARWEEGAKEPVVWVEAQGDTRRSSSPQADSFRGNPTALSTLEYFAHLPAQRELGRLDALDGATYGFPAKDASLELVRQGDKPLRLELGRSTYGQSGRYAYFPGDGRVYLLGGAELRRLASVRGSLMERRLLSMRPEEASRIELIVGEVSRMLYALTSEAGAWGAAPDSSEPLGDMVTVNVWLERLRVTRYLGPQEPAPEGAPAVELRLYRGAGGEPTEWVRLYLSQGNTAFGRSSLTQANVELPRAVVEPLVERARALVDGT